MPISRAAMETTAMETTLELPLEDERPKDAKWFGGGGCVVESGGLKHVFVRGTLVGSFKPKDQAARRLLAVSLAQSEHVHLEELADAFGITDAVLRLWRHLFEREGAGALARRAHGGKARKGTAALQAKLEAAFEAGATVDEAWETIGRKKGLSRSTVGVRRKEWAQRKAAVEKSASAPALAVVTSENDETLAVAGGERRSPPPLAVVPDVVAVESETQKLKSVEVEKASAVQHLGTWVLVAMVARLGLHETARKAADGRVSADALRLALDAVVMALGLGQKCVEGVRRLATSTAATLLMATGMPSPTWTRRTLGRFAADEGGMKVHLGMAGAYVREAEASAAGPVFYVDNHLRPYTGQHVIRRGWRMQDKRVRPGTTDYYVHDEDGRPVLRAAAPSHDSLTDWLSPIAGLLRMALGTDETILLAFDRAGAFPEQMATLREAGVEFVTYERRPFSKLADAAFTETVTLGDETLRYCDTRKNLGAGRGRVRRIAVKLPDGHQLNLLANSKRTAVELLEVMSGRWRQENGFKHGVERWGINHLDGRQVQAFPPDTVIPNPARRRLDRAIRIARVREGNARAELARLTDDSPKRAKLQALIDEALTQQAQLEAQRPSTPPKAALCDTELADTLVHHTVEYKLVLDTIRIAGANAEAELAAMLAPALPKPAEAKKTLANLFAAPGAITPRRATIDVQLDPAATAPERAAFASLLDALTRLALTMPGDQQRRPIRFTLAPTS